MNSSGEHPERPTGDKNGLEKQQSHSATADVQQTLSGSQKVFVKVLSENTSEFSYTHLCSNKSDTGSEPNTAPKTHKPPLAKVIIYQSNSGLVSNSQGSPLSSTTGEGVVPSVSSGTFQTTQTVLRSPPKAVSTLTTIRGTRSPVTATTAVVIDTRPSSKPVMASPCAPHQENRTSASASLVSGVTLKPALILPKQASSQPLSTKSITYVNNMTVTNALRGQSTMRPIQYNPQQQLALPLPQQQLPSQSQVHVRRQEIYQVVITCTANLPLSQLPVLHYLSSPHSQPAKVQISTAKVNTAPSTTACGVNTIISSPRMIQPVPARTIVDHAVSTAHALDRNGGRKAAGTDLHFAGPSELPITSEVTPSRISAAAEALHLGRTPLQITPYESGELPTDQRAYWESAGRYLASQQCVPVMEASSSDMPMLVTNARGTVSDVQRTAADFQDDSRDRSADTAVNIMRPVPIKTTNIQRIPPFSANSQPGMPSKGVWAKCSRRLSVSDQQPFIFVNSPAGVNTHQARPNFSPGPCSLASRSVALPEKLVTPRGMAIHEKIQRSVENVLSSMPDPDSPPKVVGSGNTDASALFSNKSTVQGIGDTTRMNVSQSQGSVKDTDLPERTLGVMYFLNEDGDPTHCHGDLPFKNNLTGCSDGNMTQTNDHIMLEIKKEKPDYEDSNILPKDVTEKSTGVTTKQTDKQDNFCQSSGELVFIKKELPENEEVDILKVTEETDAVVEKVRGNEVKVYQTDAELSTPQEEISRKRDTYAPPRSAVSNTCNKQTISNESANNDKDSLQPHSTGVFSQASCSVVHDVAHNDDVISTSDCHTGTATDRTSKESAGRRRQRNVVRTKKKTKPHHCICKSKAVMWNKLQKLRYQHGTVSLNKCKKQSKSKRVIVPSRASHQSTAGQSLRSAQAGSKSKTAEISGSDTEPFSEGPSKSQSTETVNGRCNTQSNDAVVYIDVAESPMEPIPCTVMCKDSIEEIKEKLEQFKQGSQKAVDEMQSEECSDLSKPGLNDELSEEKCFEMRPLETSESDNFVVEAELDKARCLYHSIPKILSCSTPKMDQLRNELVEAMAFILVCNIVPKSARTMLKLLFINILQTDVTLRGLTKCRKHALSKHTSDRWKMLNKGFSSVQKSIRRQELAALEILEALTNMFQHVLHYAVEKWIPKGRVWDPSVLESGTSVEIFESARDGIGGENGVDSPALSSKKTPSKESSDALEGPSAASGRPSSPLPTEDETSEKREMLPISEQVELKEQTSCVSATPEDDRGSESGKDGLRAEYTKLKVKLHFNSNTGSGGKKTLGRQEKCNTCTCKSKKKDKRIDKDDKKRKTCAPNQKKDGQVEKGSEREHAGKELNRFTPRKLALDKSDKETTDVADKAKSEIPMKLREKNLNPVVCLERLHVGSESSVSVKKNFPDRRGGRLEAQVARESGAMSSAANESTPKKRSPTSTRKCLVRKSSTSKSGSSFVARDKSLQEHIKDKRSSKKKGHRSDLQEVRRKVQTTPCEDSRKHRHRSSSHSSSSSQHFDGDKRSSTSDKAYSREKARISHNAAPTERSDFSSKKVHSSENESGLFYKSPLSRNPSVSNVETSQPNSRGTQSKRRLSDPEKDAPCRKAPFDQTGRKDPAVHTFHTSHRCDNDDRIESKIQGHSTSQQSSHESYPRSKQGTHKDSLWKRCFYGEWNEAASRKIEELEKELKKCAKEASVPPAVSNTDKEVNGSLLESQSVNRDSGVSTNVEKMKVMKELERLGRIQRDLNKRSKEIMMLYESLRKSQDQSSDRLATNGQDPRDKHNLHRTQDAAKSDRTKADYPLHDRNSRDLNEIHVHGVKSAKHVDDSGSEKDGKNLSGICFGNQSEKAFTFERKRAECTGASESTKHGCGDFSKNVKSSSSDSSQSRSGNDTSNSSVKERAESLSDIMADLFKGSKKGTESSEQSLKDIPTRDGKDEREDESKRKMTENCYKSRMTCSLPNEKKNIDKQGSNRDEGSSHHPLNKGKSKHGGKDQKNGHTEVYHSKPNKNDRQVSKSHSSVLTQGFLRGSKCHRSCNTEGQCCETGKRMEGETLPKRTVNKDHLVMDKGQRKQLAQKKIEKVMSEKNDCDRHKKEVSGGRQASTKTGKDSPEEVISQAKTRGIKNREVCFAILNAVYNYEPFSEPFRSEPTTDKIDDYHQIVQFPISLDHIASKLRNLYYSGLDQFVSDMRRIFWNCRLYNKSGKQFISHSTKVEVFFEKQLAAAFPDMDFNDITGEPMFLRKQRIGEGANTDSTPDGPHSTRKHTIPFELRNLFN